MSQNQSITLYSQKDGADKRYKIDLTAVDHGYTVTGWNGRRLGPLKAQPKTPTPLPYAEAKAVFDALLKSKLKGGYPCSTPLRAFPRARHARKIRSTGTMSISCR